MSTKCLRMRTSPCVCLQVMDLTANIERSRDGEG